jgi:hypothetical protein
MTAMTTGIQTTASFVLASTTIFFTTLSTMDANDSPTLPFDYSNVTRRRGHRYRHSFNSDSDYSLREHENTDHRTSPPDNDSVSDPFRSVELLILQ